jgi:raffinose/stachyose/melibiose transport system permease protein
MTHSTSVQPASASPVRRRSSPIGRPGAKPRRRGGSYLLYLLPSAVLFTCVIGLPFFLNIGISLTQWNGVNPMKWAGLGNYRQLFSDAEFWASIWHSVALIAAMAIVPTIAGLLLAAALFDVVGKKFGPRTASAFRASIYLPQVLPIVVAAIVWGWILDPQNGAINVALKDVGLGSLAHDWLGDPKTALLTVMVVLIWFQIGYPVVIFVAGLQRVDPALNEAAEIDGASWWQRLWHVTVPQIRPEIYVVVLTCTIAALRMFAWIFALTSGGRAQRPRCPRTSHTRTSSRTPRWDTGRPSPR